MTNRGNPMRRRSAAQQAHVSAEAKERFRRRGAAASRSRIEEQPEPFGHVVSATAVMAPMIKTIDPGTRAMIDAALAAKTRRTDEQAQ